MLPRGILLGALLLVATWQVARAAAAASVSLHIGDPCDPTTLTLRAEPAALQPGQADRWLITGRLAMPDFAVTGTEHVQLTDAEGHPLPLVIEENTLYREFGDIVGMRIAFELDPRALAKGLPVLTWGETVTTTANHTAPAFVFAPDAAARIRSFTIERAAAAADPARFATIQIIADSHADRYYLWYLLPMAVIFTLLVVRKRWSH